MGKYHLWNGPDKEDASDDEETDPVKRFLKRISEMPLPNLDVKPIEIPSFSLDSFLENFREKKPKLPIGLINVDIEIPHSSPTYYPYQAPLTHLNPIQLRDAWPEFRSEMGRTMYFQDFRATFPD